LKNAISIYKKHRLTLELYIKNLLITYKFDPIQNAQKIVNEHKYIQLIYAVDSEFNQISPVICKKNEDSTNIGHSKKHYFQKMQLDEDSFYISNPYIHYRTGRASLSVVYFKNNNYYVFDVNLIDILEELKLIEFNHTHDKIKRAIYFLGSTVLALVSISLITYGLYVFGSIFFNQEIDLLHDSFKSIIAVTLGLAIFDLAKQIFEHEVLFQTLEHDDEKQYKVLGRFLISIIIALSIETLLVVFKIALSENINNMLPAFYLIIGTTVMIIGLAWFYKTIIRSSCEFKD
jgi:hypothetical protein